MSDPFSPKATARRQRPEVVRRAPRNPPILRMRRVGITAEEEREALQAWAEWTDEEKFEFLDAWDNLRDSEIRAMLAEGRTEAPYAEEPREGGYDPGYGPAIDDFEVPEKANVDDLLAWVGDNPARAAAALDVERHRAQPRKTVLAALEALTG